MGGTINISEVKELNPVTSPGWNDMLLNSKDYSIFHTSNWASVLMETYGFRANYFALTEKNRFVFLMPIMELHNVVAGKKGISLPFSDYCNPIVSDQLAFSQVFDHIKELGNKRNWKMIEIRDINGSVGVNPSFASYYRHTLDLQTGAEALMKGLRENYRSKIKKAAGKNLRVDISQSQESLHDYYVLHCATRRRQGMPPQSRRYFQNIYNNIIAKDLGIVVRVTLGGKIIAGALFMFFGGKAIYKYGASEMKYSDVYPNYLLFWSVIELLCRRGCAELCFGRTDPFHHGLLQFKDGWGTQRHTIHYYRYNFSRKSFIEGNKKGHEPGFAIIKVLPLPVVKLMGTLLYRYGA